MRENYKKLTLRLNQNEYFHLLGLAQTTGLKYEPLLRKLILGETLRPRPPDTYAKLLRELSAIGNNLNQIAYWANARRGIRTDEINQAIQLVQEAWQLVKDNL